MPRLTRRELTQNLYETGLRDLIADSWVFQRFVVDHLRNAGVFLAPTSHRQQGDVLIAVGRQELGLELVHQLAKLITPAQFGQLMSDVLTARLETDAAGPTPEEPDDPNEPPAHPFDDIDG